ncbi:Ig-like domain-containing protein [Arcobacter sp. YIC-80]|uniref:Ig-like domain-containing protein n=1 Tax=Arcobacter sp. YIC-80 TaxID=3376683 RepID=UPI00384C5BCD
MYVKHLLKSSCIAISISALFIGCGGGGGSSTSSNNTTSTVKSKAYLIDSAVAGAKYVNSDGSTGFTSSDGSFDYVAGTTRFYIGNIKIGEVSSVNTDKKVFIQDIVGVPRENINHPKVLKIATFLQSIDSDLNTNKIEIAENFDKFKDINDNIENVDLSTLLTNKKFNQKNQDDVKAHLETVLNSNKIRVDKTAPKIISTTIKSNIKVSDSLVVTFSENLDRDSINTQNIQLRKVSDNTIINTRINYYNNTNSIEIDPITNLEYDETYTLTISTNIKDAGSISLENKKVYQFKTALVPDDTKPTVNIIGDTSNILLDATLKLQFSEKVEQNSLNSNSVILKDEGNLAVLSTISYDLASNILSIKPSENLKPSKTYAIKLTNKIEDLANNTLDEFNIEFTTLDEINATPLSVSSTSLSSQSTIAKNSNINIEFSKEIDTKTLSENVIIQEVGKNYSISSEIAVNGNTITVNPVNDLKDDTSYELIIKTGLKDSFGNNFDTEQKFSFQTQAIVDQKAPTLEISSIENEAKDISLDTIFSFTFNENMDENSINNGISLKTIDDVNIPITINYSNKVVTITPNTSLDYSKVYKLTLKSSIQDLAGNKYDGEPNLVGLDDKVISFITISDPSDNQEPQLISTASLGVISKDSKITIEFDEEIKEITSSNANNYLDIPFGYSFESYSNKIVTVAPTSNNEYNTNYEIILKTSIEDLAGNSLSSSKTISFKTQEQADTTAPKLLSSIPDNKVESVPVDSIIKLNFDEELDQTSVNINNIRLVKANDENTNLITNTELSYLNRTISINPNNDLDLNTDYIVIVSKDGIKDLNNNLFEGQFGNDVRISFKTQTATSATTCQNGYTQYQNSCYKVSNESKNYDEAKQACQDETATLVSKELFYDTDFKEYKSQLVSNFASALSLSKNNMYWLQEEEQSKASVIKTSLLNQWAAPATQAKTQTNYFICTK